MIIDNNDIGMLKGLTSSWTYSNKIDFFQWFIETLEFFKSKNDVRWWCKPPKSNFMFSTLGYYGKIPYRMTIFAENLTEENIVKLESIYMPTGEITC